MRYFSSLKSDSCRHARAPVQMMLCFIGFRFGVYLADFRPWKIRWLRDYALTFFGYLGGCTKRDRDLILAFTVPNPVS